MSTQFCDGCPYLSPTEQEQEKERLVHPEIPRRAHWCNVYNCTLPHGNCHPKIPTPIGCKINPVDLRQRIPPPWLAVIKHQGKTDWNALRLLAETARHGTSMLCKPLAYFSRRLQLSVSTVEKLFSRLEALGFVQRHRRVIEKKGRKYGNVLFVEVFHNRILDLTQGRLPDQVLTGMNDPASSSPGTYL